MAEEEEECGQFEIFVDQGEGAEEEEAAEPMVSICLRNCVILEDPASELVTGALLTAEQARRLARAIELIADEIDALT